MLPLRAGSGGFRLESGIRSWELVEHLFDASVSPERLDELISTWDSQIYSADPKGSLQLANVAGSVFAQQISNVLRILEPLRDAELRQAHDLLASLLGAAIVFSRDGALVAANEAATTVFDLRPGGSVWSSAVRCAQPRRTGLQDRRSVGFRGFRKRGQIVQLRPAEIDRARAGAPEGDGRYRKPARLAVTSELAWPEAGPGFCRHLPSSSRRGQR